MLKKKNLLVAVKGVKWEVRVLLQGEKKGRKLLYQCLPETGLKVLSSALHSFLICC